MRMCEKCGKNEANIHIRQIINGKESELYICSECAENIQKKLLSFLKVNNYMTNMMKEVKPKDNSKKCPQCNFDMNKIRKLGKVGCAMCYEVFEKELQPVLNKINVRRNISTNENITNVQIRKLQSELNGFVAEEKYEKAAVLRDKIKALKGEKNDNLAEKRT